jgi:hypothetical protein
MKIAKVFAILGIAVLAVGPLAGCGGDKASDSGPRIQGDDKLKDLKPAGRSAGGGAGGAAPGGAAGGGGAQAAGALDKN